MTRFFLFLFPLGGFLLVGCHHEDDVTKEYLHGAWESSQVDTYKVPVGLDSCSVTMIRHEANFGENYYSSHVVDGLLEFDTDFLLFKTEFKAGYQIKDSTLIFDSITNMNFRALYQSLGFQIPSNDIYMALKDLLLRYSGDKMKIDSYSARQFVIASLDNPQQQIVYKTADTQLAFNKEENGIPAENVFLDIIEVLIIGMMVVILFMTTGTIGLILFLLKYLKPLVLVLVVSLILIAAFSFPVIYNPFVLIVLAGNVYLLYKIIEFITRVRIRIAPK